MMIKVLSILSSLSLAMAFVPTALRQQTTTMHMADTETIFDQEQFIAEGRDMRMKYLEEQAMFALKIACENYGMWSILCLGILSALDSSLGDSPNSRGKSSFDVSKLSDPSSLAVSDPIQY